MQDGKVVPPQIGNTAQIALLKQWEREQEEAEEHGLHAECVAENVEYTPTITFRCLCGHTVNDEKPTEYLEDGQWFSLDDTETDWEGETVACDKCGREYVIKNGRAMLPEK